MMNDYNVKLESSCCPNGCSLQDETLFVGVDRVQNLPGEFPVVRCVTCKLIRTNPRPSAETIGFYYPDSYAPYVVTKPTEKKKSLLRGFPKTIYNMIFKYNINVMPQTTQGRLLEIGCASGSFLAEMSRDGWQVEGVEYSESAADVARRSGFVVHSGSLEDAEYPNGKFDMVVGWWVVEHLHDPIGVLKKLADWTTQDGWLVISIPNAESGIVKLFKRNAYDLHVPNHLYHFSPETISLTLANSGWKVEKIFHHRTLNSLFGSVGNFLCSKGAPQWLVNFFKNYPAPHYLGVLLYPVALILSIFGQTGRMTVWARKDNG